MKNSAGILAYRITNEELQFLLVHPGGPFWAKKDDGAWSIPKGEIGENEDPISAATREFEEETGFKISGEMKELLPARLKSGKRVIAWACEFDFDNTKIVSNKFKLEWPPNSGRYVDFPEVDRAEWFSPEEAKLKINPAMVSLIEEVMRWFK